MNSCRLINWDTGEDIPVIIFDISINYDVGEHGFKDPPFIEMLKYDPDKSGKKVVLKEDGGFSTFKTRYRGKVRVYGDSGG